MELIKKIKQAEAQAKELLEQARSDAAGIAESSTADRNSGLEDAADQRRQAIETAVANAANDGQAEVEALTNREAGKKQTLVDNARQKLDAAIDKVVAAIK